MISSQRSGGCREVIKGIMKYWQIGIFEMEICDVLILIFDENRHSINESHYVKPGIPAFPYSSAPWH